MYTQRPNSQMTCSIPRGHCSDLHTDPEAQGVWAAACSASLKANSIDSSVWDVQPHPLLFLVHPPSFLSSLPFILSTPSNFPRSPRRFCQAGCKTVSEQLFGKQQLGGKQRREGSHGSRSLELFFYFLPPPSLAGKTSNIILFTLDYAEFKLK